MATWLDELIAKMQGDLASEQEKQLDWMLAWAKKWRTAKPDDFDEDMLLRLRYLDDQCDDDLLKILKEEWPDTWETMKKKLVLFPVARHIIKKRAQVFRGVNGRTFLRGADGKEIPKDSDLAKAWADLWEESQADAALKEADERSEACNAAAPRVWFDGERVRVSTYDVRHVHLVVNPERSYDPYGVIAVLFERDGYGGPAGFPVYDIFGARSVETASELDADGIRMFHPTVHFSATNGIHPENYGTANEADENPLVDRWTGKPLYPFVWFTSRDGSLYDDRGGGLFYMNRLINMGLTWLHLNMEWQLAAIPVLTTTPGTDPKELSKLKSQYLHHPKFLMDLPAGVNLQFVAPSRETQSVSSLYELFMQYEALMYDLAPKSLSVNDGIPQSGIALRIEMAGLDKHRAERIKLLRPHVLRLCDIMLTVHNAYATKVQRRYTRKAPPMFPDGVWVDWEPGQLDSGPVDFAELEAKYTVAIQNNVATAADWAAEFHGIRLDEARDRIEENKKANEETNKGKLEQGMANMAGAARKVFGKKPETEQPAEEEPEAKPPEVPEEE